MRRFLMISFACMALAACGILPEAQTVACEADLTTGPAFAVGDLQTKVGNPPVSAIAGEWPNPYFGVVNFGIEANRSVTDEGGVRFIEAVRTTPNFQGQYLHRYWIDTGENSTPDAGQTLWNLTGDSFYFRLVPMDNAPTPGTTSPITPDDQWKTTMQMYDFDDFSVVLIEILGHEAGHTMDFTIFDDVVDEATTDVPYVPDDHHWFRARHDSGTNMIHLETAPKGCGTWTTHLSAGPMVSRIDQYTIEFTWSVNTTEEYPSTIGYVGPLNPEPTDLSGDLVTGILPLPKVPGLVAVVGDLITEVETP